MMADPVLTDKTRKEEYVEMLNETIRTNPYRKAATAMANVMSKHGIESANLTGKPLQGPPEKKCALSKSLKLAHSCNQKLNVIRDDLQILCNDFGKTGGSKTNQPKSTSAVDENENVTSSSSPETADLSDKATMAGHLLTLIGEAEKIAKRVYETAVGLHVTEDFLRQPEDLKILDFSHHGRIQIPEYSFNHASQLCLEWLHSTALKWLRGFKEDGDEDNAVLIKIFENFTKAVKDFSEAVCLANQVFRVLLYPNVQGKECLQEYIQGLGHVLKNDIIMEIQALRRNFDNIQYTFERLGWTASIAWMKYSGKSLTVETLNDTGIQVDRSRFQYKFYDGPQRSKGRKKEPQLSAKEKPSRGRKHPQNKVSSARNHVEAAVATAVTPQGGEAGAAGNSTIDSNIQTQGSGVNEKENVKVRAVTKPGTARAKKYTKEATSKSMLPKPRKSRSTSDILKTKKIVRKKGKAKTNVVRDIITQEMVMAGSSISASGENQMSGFSVGDNRDSMMKMYRNDKMSNVSLGSAKKRSTQALIPPPKIPVALRQQFNAVFGPALAPLKTQKPLKKKGTAGSLA